MASKTSFTTSRLPSAYCFWHFFTHILHEAYIFFMFNEGTGNTVWVWWVLTVVEIPLTPSLPMALVLTISFLFYKCNLHSWKGVTVLVAEEVQCCLVLLFWSIHTVLSLLKYWKASSFSLDIQITIKLLRLRDLQTGYHSELGESACGEMGEVLVYGHQGGSDWRVVMENRVRWCWSL
jgi:hypothetical protein